MRSRGGRAVNKEQPKTKRPGNNPNGRPKGSLNKATTQVREAIAEMMQKTAPKMAGWLDRVAEEDPAKALDLALKAAEYHIPKLARTEHAGDPENPVMVAVVERRLVRPSN